jgi:hypothetical protein
LDGAHKSSFPYWALSGHPPKGCQVNALVVKLRLEKGGENLVPVQSEGGSSLAGIQLRLQNFRLFEDSGWLDLAPLTCMVGRNSSGKSSILSALLLLKQSIENEVYGSAITPLALSGSYCDLGRFRDVVHNHDRSAEISFSFRLPIPQLPFDRPRQESGLISIPTPRSVQPFQWYFRPVGFESTKKPGKGHIEVQLTFSEDEPFGPSLSRCEFKSDEHGHVKFVRTISGRRRQHWRTYSESLALSPLFFIPTPRTFFPIIRRREKLFERLAPTQKAATHRAEMICGGSFSYIELLLRRSQMIGPFRQPPERRYAFAGFGASRSGPSGEQAIDLLITEALLNKAHDRPLISAVGFWLKVLRLADSLRIRSVAKRLNLFEVDLKFRGRTIRNNLADVGFGVSQVLPVLVQGLLAQPGGVFLVQEPEIHLHPDAQAGLADFFIYLAAQGIMCVIETHSEYLLTRLRRRLAEGGRPLRKALPRLKDSHAKLGSEAVSVIFTDLVGSEGRAVRLQIGPGFQFEALPSGFMSQITDDRLALLKEVSKRRG